MILFLLFSSVATMAGNEIDLTKVPPTPGPVPNSITLIPVSATISETELGVFFESSVGTATITVYDASNQLVEQQVIDTESLLEVYMPVDTWGAGNYTLTITYGDTTLQGVFLIE
jgi:hypothetical protein